MLKNSDPRCSGIFTLGKPEACQKRDRCLRHLSFHHLDREAGVKSYRDIGVMMASKHCEMFMEKCCPEGHRAVKDGKGYRASV